MCLFHGKKIIIRKISTQKQNTIGTLTLLLKDIWKSFYMYVLTFYLFFSSKFVHYYPSGIFNQSVSGMWYYVWGHSPHNLIETYHYSILMTILYCLQGPLCNKIANFVWIYCFSTSIYRMIFHKFYVKNCWNAKPWLDSQTNFKILRQSAEETWP